MKNQKFKNFATFVAILILSCIFIAVGRHTNQPKLGVDETEFFTARVVTVRDVIEERSQIENNQELPNNKMIIFFAEITSGNRKSEWVMATQYIDYIFAAQPREVSEGDVVILSSFQNPETNKLEWNFVEHSRMKAQLFLVGGFFLLILLIGRTKGIATLASLLLTIAAIFWVYIPALLNGRNAYLTTAVVAVFIIFMSLTLLNGINKKSFCAIVGNIGGLAVSGGLALLMNQLLNITGIVDEQYVFLMYIDTATPLDLRGVVWGSIIIGSLGAVMDVAMSLASAMNELSETMENKSVARMIRSGMNIGKDAIGTMTNTLILAYVGGSLATVLLLTAYKKAPLLIFNMEMIVVEVLQAILGSIGILVAVPITVLVSAYLFNHAPKSEKPVFGPPLGNFKKVTALPDTADADSTQPQNDTPSSEPTDSASPQA